jgi:hypothetical protein
MVGLSAPREPVHRVRHRTHETMLAPVPELIATDADAIAASLTAPHAFAAVFERVNGSSSTPDRARAGRRQERHRTA